MVALTVSLDESPVPLLVFVVAFPVVRIGLDIKANICPIYIIADDVIVIIALPYRMPGILRQQINSEGYGSLK